MWDQRYSEPGYAYGREPNDFLASVADRLPVGRTLSIAEGEGRNGVFLASLGHHVVGVDSSRVGLDKALALARERNLEIEAVHADLNDYVIEPSGFSAVVSIFCHLPADLRRRVHRAAVVGLRPGGAFVLEAYRPEQLEYRTGGPVTLDRLYPLAELREDLVGLELEVASDVVREVREGRFHEGQAATVQILGWKPAQDQRVSAGPGR